MNSDTTYTSTTSAASATSHLGYRVGKLCRGGEVIELVSDLGGGKTVFVQGLARGLGYEGDVASPTFTISRDYHVAGERMLHHFDLYRISSGDIVAQELAECTADPQAVVAVEWASNVAGALPDERLTVTITPSSQPDERDITITASPKFAYVVAGLHAEDQQ